LAIEPASTTDQKDSKVSNKLQAAKEFDASMNGSDSPPIVQDDDDQWEKINQDGTSETIESTDVLGKGAPITQSSVSATAANEAG